MTLSALRSSATVALTAFAFSESVSFPLGALTSTGEVVVPDWSGKRWSMTSVARWLSVPGMSKFSVVRSPARPASTTSTTAITTHAATTHQRWRPHQWPSR
jgi:hypothetical protein